MNDLPIPMAIAYDFDETLAVRNMLTYALPELKGNMDDFIHKLETLPKSTNGDVLLICLYELLQQAKQSGIKLTQETLHNFGRFMEPFPGLSDYFSRINAYALQKGVALKHYIISSNLREVIEGSPVAQFFHHIYGSAFLYDSNGEACWPAMNVNHTVKTQYLFRISKGCLDAWDDNSLNEELGDTPRAVPFSNIVYVGDGETDIPCFCVVRKQGGYAFAVYNPEKEKSVATGSALFAEGRVDKAVPADYREGSRFDHAIRAVVDSIAAQNSFIKA